MVSSNPSDAAVDWFMRVRAADLTADELAAFASWRANPGHEAAFEKVQRLWGGADQVALRPEILRMREAALAVKKARPSYIPMAAAAIVVAFLGGAMFINSSLRDGASLQTTPDGGRFATGIGDLSAITLSDGSVIRLDTDSATEAVYSTEERAVTLSRGQALFEVAKGDPRPFVVYAGDRRIVATGTAFDVRLDKSQVEVTLVEGHVTVDQVGPSAENGMDPQRLARLEPGERLVAKQGVPVSVSSADIDHVTSWTAGKLVFLDTRLADAVAEVNRYTHMSIILTDSRLADLRVNGVFKTGNSMEFASALAEVYPVTIDRTARGQVRIASK